MHFYLATVGKQKVMTPPQQFTTL